MKTTLNAIRKHEPCKDGWEKLLSYLGKTKADDEPLLITTILDSNGLDDALWCLRAVEGYDREIRLYAVWCARQVQHLMTDQRTIDVLDVAERYANGEATEDELAAAWSDARATRYARYTTLAACDAAAATAAARAAARAAADAAEAAWSVWSAAAAATAAARAAARAAADAADAAARAAAWEAEQEMGIRQAAELRRICEEVEG